MALSIPIIFEDIAKAKSITERKKILLENKSTPLMELLKYAFHPDIKFALPEGAPPYDTFIGSVDENNPTYLYPNIRKFYLLFELPNPLLSGVILLTSEQIIALFLIDPDYYDHPQ